MWWCSFGTLSQEKSMQFPQSIFVLIKKLGVRLWTLGRGTRTRRWSLFTSFLSVKRLEFVHSHLASISRTNCSFCNSPVVEDSFCLFLSLYWLDSKHVACCGRFNGNGWLTKLARRRLSNFSRLAVCDKEKLLEVINLNAQLCGQMLVRRLDSSSLTLRVI